MALPLSLIMPPRSAAIADRVGLRAAQVASSSKPSATTQFRSLGVPHQLLVFCPSFMRVFVEAPDSMCVGMGAEEWKSFGPLSSVSAYEYWFSRGKLAPHLLENSVAHSASDRSCQYASRLTPSTMSSNIRATVSCDRSDRSIGRTAVTYRR